MANDRKKEVGAKPRRSSRKKGRSVGATLGTAAAAGLAGVGATVAAQYVATNTDNRLISGIAAGVGVATTLAGIATKSPLITAAGAGLAIGAGGVLIDDVVFPVADSGTPPPALPAGGARNAGAIVEAVRRELQEPQQPQPQPNPFAGLRT